MKALIDIIPRMWAPSWCVSEETVFLVYVGPVWPSHVVSEGYNIYTFIKDAKAEKSSMAGKNPRIRNPSQQPDELRNQLEVERFRSHPLYSYIILHDTQSFAVWI